MAADLDPRRATNPRSASDDAAQGGVEEWPPASARGEIEKLMRIGREAGR